MFSSLPFYENVCVGSVENCDNTSMFLSWAETILLLKPKPKVITFFFFFFLSFHVPALKKNICGAGKLLFWPCFRQLSLQKSDSAASFAAAVGVTPSRNDLDESPLHQRANR